MFWKMSCVQGKASTATLTGGDSGKGLERSEYVNNVTELRVEIGTQPSRSALS